MRQQQQQTQQTMVVIAQMLNSLQKDYANFVANLYKGKERFLFQNSNILVTKLT